MQTIAYYPDISYNLQMNKEQIRKAIYLRAISRLAARDYSRKGLEGKLVDLKKRFPKNTIYPFFTIPTVREVIDSLVEQGLINEERSIRNIIESSLSGRYGQYRIVMKLKRKLYPTTLIENIFKEYAPIKRDLERITDSAKLKYEIFKRKAGTDKQKIFQIKNKLRMFLAYRGFNSDEIEKIIAKIKMAP